MTRSGQDKQTVGTAYLHVYFDHVPMHDPEDVVDPVPVGCDRIRDHDEGAVLLQG